MKDLTNFIFEDGLLIIAEIGMNHDGSFGNALQLIKEAKNVGANGVKFQLHLSEAETLISAPKPPYFELEERFDYFKRTNFTVTQWKQIINYAHKKGLYFIISPFSHKAVDIIEEFDIDAYKIASGETTNRPLLEYIETKNKPVFLSTGMSNWEEISNAVEILRKNLSVIFQCTSQYPCQPEKVGLNVIKLMKTKFKNLTIGYSDHTLNDASALGALIYGAKVFEKHFTLSRKMYGPDARFSYEPKHMERYISNLKFLSKVLKNPIEKDEIEEFKEMKLIFEKSIITAKNLKKGHIIKMSDLDFKKPGDGIRADSYDMFLGKELKRNVLKNEKLFYEDLK